MWMLYGFKFEVKSDVILREFQLKHIVVVERRINLMLGVFLNMDYYLSLRAKRYAKRRHIRKMVLRLLTPVIGLSLAVLTWEIFVPAHSFFGGILHSVITTIYTTRIP